MTPPPNTPGEAREFWVRPQRDAPPWGICVDKPIPGGIHVISFDAYQAVKDERDAWEKDAADARQEVYALKKELKHWKTKARAAGCVE